MDSFNTYSEEFVTLLDQSVAVFASQKQSAISQVLDEITDKLRYYRSNLCDENWKKLVDIGRNHCLFKQIQKDPFTRRSFDKPKGYSGDAILIDFIYGSGSYIEGVSKSSITGRQIYTRNRMVPACQAVRNRRDLIATEIGETLKRTDAARILSVAAGHLREADQVHWGGVENLELFLVIDQDLDSLSEIATQNYHHNLIIHEKTVRQVLSGKLIEQEFDLIYVTGLYDYLPDQIAVRLTEILFAKLRSNGKLLIANFVPTAADAGYMELFMNWFLIYRNEEHIKTLVSSLPDDRLLSRRVYLENTGQICFAELIHR